MPAERVIVVGAGVSGLACAYRLQQRGFDVVVLEASDHVGGKTTGTRRDGFVLNTGATVLGASYDAMLTLAREIGVDGEVFAVKPVIGVFAEGRAHWLRGSGPGAVIDFVRTPLLSARSKLLLWRLALDAWRARRAAGYDKPSERATLDVESVADYCERRLNAEIRDRLLVPLMGGLFVVDGARMSIADLYFSLVKFLGGGMLGYRAGIDFFARALAERLSVRLNDQVSLVQADGDRVRVVSTRGEDEVDGVVLTVAAPLVPPIYPALDPSLQGMLLEGLKPANMISVRLALRERVGGEALIVVAAEGELGGVSTVMFEHNISPGSAPPGKGIVGALLYHEWVSSRMELSDDELLADVLPELERLVPGLAEIVEDVEVTRWQPAALRSEPGMHRVIASIDGALDNGHRIQLAGDYLSIPSINGSVVSGENAARRLAAALGA
jgi:oxygen-dependent protoporphyrinogen oxidase